MKKRSGLIAKKIGNSSFYTEKGIVYPATILKVDDCVVSNVKTIEKDGYTAIQLASIEKKVDIKKIKKPQQKIFSNLKIKPKKILKEFRVDIENALKLGTSLNVSHFEKWNRVSLVRYGPSGGGCQKLCTSL